MTSGWMSKESHKGDDKRSFGQFLSMSILGAAVLAFVNAWNGKLSSADKACILKLNTNGQKWSNRIETMRRAEQCRASFHIYLHIRVWWSYSLCEMIGAALCIREEVPVDAIKSVHNFNSPIPFHLIQTPSYDLYYLYLSIYSAPT